MRHLLLFTFLTTFLFALPGCSSSFETDVHTPDVVEQDEAYTLDAGTVPTERICPVEERLAGRCG